MTAETVRESGAYRVMTPEQAVELIDDLDDSSPLYLTPLFGGVDPARGWKTLELFEDRVLPHVPREVIPRWGVRQG